MTTLKEKFINEGAKITYRELSERGGKIIAWYDINEEKWFHHHETETKVSFENMSKYKASAIFPRDAVQL